MTSKGCLLTPYAPPKNPKTNIESKHNSSAQGNCINAKMVSDLLRLY